MWLTKEYLEEAAGESIDPDVLEKIIREHPEAWIKEERKKQSYYFATLRNLVGSEYARTKRKLGQEAN